MVIHMVLFTFKETTDTKTLDEIRTALLGLKETISLIKEFSFGKNFSARSEGFDYGLLVKLSSKADLKTYQDHPEHQLVVKEVIRPALSKILAVDYDTTN